MNPFEILAMVKNGANPQQLALSFLEQNMANSPMGANLLQMARQGNGAGIEQVARNVCAQRGVNYDQEFNAFKRQLGIK